MQKTQQGDEDFEVGRRRREVRQGAGEMFVVAPPS
jgi:hypothetical protein